MTFNPSRTDYGYCGMLQEWRISKVVKNLLRYWDLLIHASIPLTSYGVVFMHPGLCLGCLCGGVGFRVFLHLYISRNAYPK